MLHFSFESDYYYHVNQKEQEIRLASPRPEPQQVLSSTLLGSNKELVILHNGRAYRLRLTRNGKLILTA